MRFKRTIGGFGHVFQLTVLRNWEVITIAFDQCLLVPPNAGTGLIVYFLCAQQTMSKNSVIYRDVAVLVLFDAVVLKSS